MNPNNRSEVGSIFSEGDLTTLVDLQRFLAEELAQGGEQGVDFSRAFTPLTDGLGIQTKPSSAATKAPAYTAAPSQPITEFRASQPLEAPRSAARLIVDAELEPMSYEEEEVTVAHDFDLDKNPPPVPAVTRGRRFLAGFVDQCFVFTACLLTLAITSNAMSSEGGDLSARFVKELTNPAFVRSAGLEFLVIWLGYLTLSLGFLEMTFGMWVWGLRVNYGENGRFWKKLARVFMGMFFYPFVAPTLLLLFQRKGKNLIDGLTHTEIYRS